MNQIHYRLAHLQEFLVGCREGYTFISSPRYDRLKCKMKKKRSGRRKHCELAVVTRSQNRHRPPSRGRRTAKISSAGDDHHVHPKTQFGEDRCTQFRVIVVTDTARPPQTHRQDRLQYTAPLASAQCNKTTPVVYDKTIEA